MTWRKIAPCDASACVETSEADGFVSVRSSQRPNEVARFSRDEWDAFLAGLRATESAERGEVVGGAASSDVELVARAIQEADPEVPGARWPDWLNEANAAIAALAAAGRLLPPAVQTREERGWWKNGEIQTWWSFHNDGAYRDPDRVRTISTLADDGSPYGGATLTGKWRNVDE